MSLRTVVPSPSFGPRSERASSLSIDDPVPLPVTPPPQLRWSSNHSSVGSKSVTESDTRLSELSPPPQVVEEDDEDEPEPSCCCLCYTHLKERREKEAKKCRPYLAVGSLILGVIIGIADIVTDCLVIQDWTATGRFPFALALGLFILAANATNTSLLLKHGWSLWSFWGMLGMGPSVESIRLLKTYGLSIQTVDQEFLAHFYLYRLVEASVESFPSAAIQIFILIVSQETRALHITSTSISIFSLAVGLVRGVSNGADHVSTTFDPLFESLYNNFLLILVVAADFMLRVSAMTLFFQITQWQPYVFFSLAIIFLFEALLHGIRLTVFDPDVLLGLHLTRRMVTVPAIFIFSLLACVSGAPEVLVVVDPRQDFKLRRLFWIGLFVRDTMSLIFICCFMYFGPFHWLDRKAADTVWFSLLLICACVKWIVLLFLRFWRLRSYFADMEKFKVDTMRQIAPSVTILQVE